MTANLETHRSGVTRDIFIILLLACAVLLPSLWTRDLWNPDEPRYMAVGWGMVETGDYLVPHLSGYVYPDKPPLFFWLAAFFYRIGFGLNGGRVVAALATVGTILVTYFLGRRRIGERAGLTAALVTMTLMFFLATSKMGVIDTLVTFLMVSTIACGLRAMEPETGARRRWWLAAYALTGLAVLTKGPVGVVVPLIVLASYGIAMRKKVRPGGWVHLAGAFLMVNIVGWWLVPALVAGGGEYANEILFSQTAKRLVKSPSHEAPFYHYLMLLPGIMFPWSLLLVPAGWSAWKAWRRDREPAAALGVTWFLSIFLFFSAVSGKRAGYILPIAPAVGLILARYLLSAERAGQISWPRLYRVLSRITLAVMGAGIVLCMISALVAGPITGLLYPNEADLQAEVAGLAKGAPLALALPAAVIILLVIYGWRRALERPAALAAVLVLLVVVTSVAVDLVLLPKANNVKSGLNFAEAADPYLRRAAQVCLYKNDFSGVYNIYTDRVSIPIIPTRGQALEEALASPDRVAVIGRDADIEKKLGQPPAIGREAVRVRVGHRNMVLLVNWPETEDR
jgi:4-amino-4-deoxy-L-arabinose transferase-like glycosyltransferase